MYCVIQEIQLKKPNTHGEFRELKTDSFTISFGGVTKTKYLYNYGGGRFERPIRKAFKLSIHESHRVNGVVTKKQYVVTTVEYYWLATGWFGLGDYDNTITSIAEKLKADVGDVYDIIYAKLDLLKERVKKEYQKTEEYKTHSKHEKIIKQYQKAKAGFAKTYSCDADEYDYCYNVFGELMNQNYLDTVIAGYKQRRSYQQNSYSNYGSGFDWDAYKNNYSSYLNPFDGNYTDDEKVILKKFYRTLSISYHPDNIQGNGDEMKLANKLKEQWGI